MGLAPFPELAAQVVALEPIVDQFATHRVLHRVDHVRERLRTCTRRQPPLIRG